MVASFVGFQQRVCGVAVALDATLDKRKEHPLVYEAGRRLSSLAGQDPGELANVIERNMAAIDGYREEAENARTIHERIADVITSVSGSLPFVYFHVVFFAMWIGMNLGVAGLPAFDPYPFGMLTTLVSLEAIFLSTFVLVSQNRQARIDERRTELDLHINLLSEYEITRILILTHELSKRMGVKPAVSEELAELEKDVKPEVLLRELESRSSKDQNSQNGNKPAM